MDKKDKHVGCRVSNESELRIQKKTAMSCTKRRFGSFIRHPISFPLKFPIFSCSAYSTRTHGACWRLRSFHSTQFEYEFCLLVGCCVPPLFTVTAYRCWPTRPEYYCFPSTLCTFHSDNVHSLRRRQCKHKHTHAIHSNPLIRHCFVQRALRKRLSYRSEFSSKQTLCRFGS